MITNINQLDFTKQYTYADYLTWQFIERVELIKGWIFKMSPSPSKRHQLIAVDLIYFLQDHLRKTPCTACMAPMDVRLLNPLKSNENNKIYTVVQPDIFVVCDESKFDEKGCIGAPDFIIEILSLGNTKRDVDEKFRLYQENGVLEYWIVSPYDEIIQVFDLIENKYLLRNIYCKPDTIASKAVEGFILDLEEVFYHS
jgi:Uma2 family endonuclease